MTEEEFWNRITDGVYDELIKRLRHRGFGKDTAYEYAHVACISGAKSCKTIRDPNALVRFLFVAARNQFLDDCRRATREKHTEARDFTIHLPATPVDRVSDLFDTRCDASRILDALDPPDRSLLQRHFVEGMSYAALGEELGMGPDAVYKRVWRLRRRILESQVSRRPPARVSSSNRVYDAA